MSRLYTGGAELGHAQAEGCIVNGAGGAPAFDTTLKRSGAASLKCTTTNQHHRRAFAGVLNRSYYFRIWHYMPTNPTGLHRCMSMCTSAAAVVVSVEVVNGTNCVRLLNSAASVIATGTIALTAGQWNMIEVRVMVPTAGNGSVEMKINGVTDIAATSTALGNTAMGVFFHGVISGNIGGLAHVSLDDIAVNDDQGTDQNSWPGDGSVYALLGAADPGTGTNTTNWTKPGGATTNRHTSVGKPLVYQADSTIVGDAEKFVRNPTNAASQFDIDMTDYTTAGIPSGEAIALVQAVAGTGSASATDTSGSLECLSNPVVSSKAITAFDNGVASSVVTTWPRVESDVIYNPTVTRGTRPRVRLSRASANRTVMCNMLALIVESKPVSTYFGATSLAISLGVYVDGQVSTPGVTYYGSFALPVTFGRVINGQRKTFGQVLAPFVFGETISGQRKTFGQIVLPISASIATAGNRLANTLYGITSLPITFGAAIDGKRKTLGQIALPVIFSKDVRGQRKTFGQLLSPFIFGKSVVGQRKTFNQVSLPLSIAIATSGLRLGLTLYGTLTFPMTFTKDVRGQRKTFGQIAMPMTFVKDLRGQRKTFGQITFPIIFTKEAVGRKNVFGQLSMLTLFGKETAGLRKTFSQFVMPMIFSKEVVGRKQTFGRIELPISVPIFVAGYGWIGAKTYYGQLAMPINFDKQIIAQRKTFGQITSPLIFGSVAQGSRHTFSELEFDLIWTIDTNGQIKVFNILNDAFDLYLGDQDILAAYVGSEQVWP